MWDVTRQVLTDIEAYASSTGALEQWKYAGYAAKDQDVIGSYGAETKAFLRRVSNDYDREQFFQRPVPGGFKL
jgi:hypothetical protein